jgi:hypothetical protein
MRRLVVLFSVATLSLVGGVIGTSAVASGSTDTTVPSDAATEVHPAVGAWIFTVDGFPEEFTELMTVHADGTLEEASTDPTSAMGSWEATGPNSFNLTFNDLSLTEEGSLLIGTIRASGEVSEDGQSFTAEFTLELTGEGAPTGENGPGSVTGTRINVEPMGTPVGPVEALFPDLFPPEEGTTPAGTEPVGTTPSDAAVATTTG